jgi:hypothetical protein
MRHLPGRLAWCLGVGVLAADAGSQLGEEHHRAEMARNQ